MFCGGVYRTVQYNVHTKGIGEKEKKQCLLTMDESMFLKK